jgi:hypothetical protein
MPMPSDAESFNVQFHPGKPRLWMKKAMFAAADRAWGARPPSAGKIYAKIVKMDA